MVLWTCAAPYDKCIHCGHLASEGLVLSRRTDITDRATLEKNFRENFEALNCVRLTPPAP